MLSKKNLIGELMYIICNYDKGKTQKKLWNKKLYHKLMTDVYFCRNFLEILYGAPIDTNYFFSKFSVLEKEKIDQKFFMSEYGKMEEILKEGKVELTEKEKEICSVMLNEIIKIHLLLLEKNKNHKTAIKNTFKAIHNIPKILIDAENCFFSGAVSCSVEDAWEVYEFWRNYSE